jgi:hypothetical protein
MNRSKDWMSYSFDKIEYGKKLTKQSIFSINFNNKIKKESIPSYKDALYNNARIMRDSFSEPFDVLFSGGIDSEIVVRTFKDLGIKHNTFIFRLENDYNVRDVNDAIDICQQISIPYKIIDFNLKNFFENDALYYFNNSFVPRAGRLPRLKWFEYLDNIPVFCDGEPYWKRINGGDYSQKSKWNLQLGEDAYSSSLYARNTGRDAIGDWYEYTPEIMLSHLQHPITQKLLNDKETGKLSSWSSRGLMHQEIWPEVKIRKKLVGYEGAVGEPGTGPDFIGNFQRTFMDGVVNTKHVLSQDQVFDLLVE